MSTRRKFLLTGSMTAAALIAARPFKVFAAGSPALFSPFSNTNHLVLLHTAALEGPQHRKTLQFISAIKNKTSNTLLLDADGSNDSRLQFDVPANDDIASGYRIITKGGIKTGLITIGAGEENPVEAVSRLASVLKKDKGCRLVVCLSTLGYNNGSKTDDKKLAALSADVDIILCASPDNFCKQPVVLHNRDKHEVIIQSAFASAAAFGKIEIGFDKHGNKNHVHLLSQLPAKEKQEGCIIAA